MYTAMATHPSDKHTSHSVPGTCFTSRGLWCSVYPQLSRLWAYMCISAYHTAIASPLLQLHVPGLKPLVLPTEAWTSHLQWHGCFHPAHSGQIVYEQQRCSQIGYVETDRSR